MPRRIESLCVGSLCAVLFAHAAAAQTTSAGAATPALPQYSAEDAATASAQRQADLLLLDRAASAMDQGRAEGLVPHLPALNAALDKSVTTKPQDPSLYVAISLVLGGYYLETFQHRRALGVANKGLRHDPLDPTLASQKAIALMNLDEYGEALTTLDTAVAGDRGARTAQARVHRLKGAVLIHMGRLDEAEAALKTAQTLQPRHTGPAKGLKQIAQMRRSPLVSLIFGGSKADAAAPTQR